MLNAIRKLEDDIFNEIDSNLVSDAVTQIELLHRKDDGFITIAVKNSYEFVQYHYKIDSLKENIGKALAIPDVNLYITPNSFFKPYRKIENIRKLNALYLDIDYYNAEQYKDYDFGRIKYLLEKDYFNSKIPQPNFIVNTGRGVAIYWLIEPVPYKVLPLWNAIQKDFQDKLKDIGADAKSIDSARLMRLSGSINQKSNSTAEIIIYDDNYVNTLREIQEEYLPELTPYVKNVATKAKGKKTKVVKLFTMYSLHHARLLDLIKLQELREGYCRNEFGLLAEKGHRELMCFLYRYWSNCFTADREKALIDTLEFNSNFASPLTNRDVEKVTISAENAYEEWLLNDFNLPKDAVISEKLQDKISKVRTKRDYKFLVYNYKNATLIKMLNITEDEMKELSTIFDLKEKHRRDFKKRRETRRNDTGLTKRQIEAEKNRNSIMKLKDEGIAIEAIASELGISIKTVYRILSK